MEDIIVYAAGLGISLLTAAGFAAKWRKAKRLLKESAELLTAISNAVEDDEITKEEVREIIKEGKDIIDALKNETA
jgi:urease gamma subunit